MLDSNSVDPVKWNRLVDGSSSGVPFVYFEFNQALREAAYYIVVPDGNGDYLAGCTCRLRGRLPAVGDFLAALWMDGSAMVCKTVTGEEAVRSLKEIVYVRVLDLAREKNLAQVFLTHWSREEDQRLLEELGFVVESNASFEIDLRPQSDHIYQKLRPSNRRLVKQATKKNVRTTFYWGKEAIASLGALQELREKTQERAVRKNRNASMLLKPDAFLRNLLEQMQEKAIVGLAVHEGTVNAGILVLATPERAYYYLGGSDYELVRRTRAANLLHWHCIQYLKAQGVHYYDLGGVPLNPSGDHPAYGVYRFKKSFGGELKVYYAGYRVVNKYKYFLYRKAFAQPVIRRIVNRLLHRI